ncbi:HIT domain-containing protein [Alphaproteobacteria bacterium]|nr:HIT domain-containing protein [Alphaproteobacteria bacterium]MDB9824584.1 HIT domain-containing protein [Alphaproteobacteria bacterium]
MIYSDQNIFAKILRKEIPCEKILENNFILSFNDISPKAKLHVLVIPKSPYIDIYDFNKNASKEEVIGFWNGVNETIEKLQIADNGFQLKTHKGETGGQEVFHFHVHILSND